MADYNFRSLSPHDFELLCRDLLQKHLGVHLESFTTGRDSGFDFRYRGAGENLIVQCKHYAESGCRAMEKRLSGSRSRSAGGRPLHRILGATHRRS